MHIVGGRWQDEIQEISYLWRPSNLSLGEEVSSKSVSCWKGREQDEVHDVVGTVGYHPILVWEREKQVKRLSLKYFLRVRLALDWEPEGTQDP